MRQMVTFKKINLMEPNFSLGNFDVVFCRNVLIYFDGPTKATVLNRIAQCVNPGGFLMLGAAESLVGVTQSFEPAQDRRGLYKLASTAKSASAA
jgi:chemotaxis protein methyltransferase CheR